jgi:hypothetical protein
LFASQVRKRNVDVANVDVDHAITSRCRGIARNVPGGLAVTDDVESLGPDLCLIHVTL